MAVTTAAALLGWSGGARADVFDLALQRLVATPDPGKPAAPSVIDQAAYRTLASELGTVLAPRFLSPADTLGWSGFQFGFDAAFTSISNQACPGGAMHDASGKPNDVRQCPWAAGTSGVDGMGNSQGVPGWASTVSLMVRKGIWLPFPSVEFGAGATHLLQSNIYALQLYAKLALHEGYHDWPIPSLAVRGSVSRMLGSSQLDLTVAQVDAEISKSFGLFGTVTLVPYFGSAALFIVARGQVLDTTPGVDALGTPGDLNANAVFPDQDTIVRWRFFAGFRLNYSVLTLAFDWTVTACGDWTGAPSNECNHAGANIPDSASTQHTLAVSGGFLF